MSNPFFLLPKYLFGRRYRPIFAPPAELDRQELVIFVHGLIHRSWVMLPLAEKIRRAGYVCWVYDYASSRGDVAQHGAALREFLQRAAGQYPKHRISLVVHSMGGLISRWALGDETVIPRERRGVYFMLAVPHRGSPAATFWCRALLHLAPRLYRCLPDLCDGAPGGVPVLPYPEWPVISIRAEHDRLVMPVSSAYPESERSYVVSSGHAFVMDKSDTARIILDELEKSVDLMKI